MRERRGFPSWARVLWLLAFLWALSAGELAGQITRGLDVTIEAPAATTMSAMWQDAARDSVEQVGCIEATVGHHGAVRVEDVARLPSAAADDDFHAKAERSLRECDPPEYLGTVHTHTRSGNKRQPGQFGPISDYDRFSEADHRVMANWLQRHRESSDVGVFCLLFSDTQAWCVRARLDEAP